MENYKSSWILTSSFIKAQFKPQVGYHVKILHFRRYLDSETISLLNFVNFTFLWFLRPSAIPYVPSYSIYRPSQNTLTTSSRNSNPDPSTHPHSNLSRHKRPPLNTSFISSSPWSFDNRVFLFILNLSNLIQRPLLSRCFALKLSSNIWSWLHKN